MKKSRGNQKTLETNENRNITFKNLWDAANAVLRGKFIATEAFKEHPNLSPDRTEKRRTSKAQSQKEK